MLEHLGEAEAAARAAARRSRTSAARGRGRATSAATATTAEVGDAVAARAALAADADQRAACDDQQRRRARPVGRSAPRGAPMKSGARTTAQSDCVAFSGATIETRPWSNAIEQAAVGEPEGDAGRRERRRRRRPGARAGRAGRRRGGRRRRARRPRPARPSADERAADGRRGRPSAPTLSRTAKRSAQMSAEHGAERAGSARAVPAPGASATPPPTTSTVPTKAPLERLVQQRERDQDREQRRRPDQDRRARRAGVAHGDDEEDLRRARRRALPTSANGQRSPAWIVPPDRCDAPIADDDDGRSQHQANAHRASASTPGRPRPQRTVTREDPKSAPASAPNRTASTVYALPVAPDAHGEDHRRPPGRRERGGDRAPRRPDPARGRDRDDGVPPVRAARPRPRRACRRSRTSTTT